MMTTSAQLKLSFLQELNVAELIVGDIAAFAAGQAVNASPTIAGQKLSVSVIHLPNGPASPYVVISGTFFGEVLEAFAIGEQFSAGQPVQVAMKEGNSWYGITAQKAA